MKRSIFLIVVVVACVYCVPAMGQSTVSKNLSLSDYITYLDLYAPQVPDSTSGNVKPVIGDVASWVDDRGGTETEFALICLPQVGNNSGVAVVNVTNPASINHLKTIRISDTPEDNTPQDVKIHDNNAYVAQDDNEEIPAYWVDLHQAVDNPGDAKAGTNNTNFEFLSYPSHQLPLFRSKWVA